jgi:hypothetical protein
MSLESRKLDLVQQLLLVDNEDILDRMQEALNSASSFVLSDAQKAELDAQEARYQRGEGKFSPLEDSISRIKANYAASRVR